MPDDLYNKLITEGFERVERDDRLLDVFPDEISEKGIELWDKWGEDTVGIIRIHLQKSEKGITRHILQREVVEASLRENIVSKLL